MENSSQKIINHDLLFKEVLKLFFEPFMEAFFPNLHQLIDFRHETCVSEELIIDAKKGKRLIADLVIQTKLKTTQKEIIIHLEPQSYFQTIFNRRMFLYNALLKAKLNKPVLSIAIYSHLSKQNIKTYDVEQFPGQSLKFEFPTVHLRSKHWLDYVKQENVVSATFMCLMKHDKQDRVKLKFEFIRILHEANISESVTKFLYGFFDQYLKLTEEEEEELMTKIKHYGKTHKLPKLPIAIEERARERGEKRGLEIGQKQGVEIGKKRGLEIGEKQTQEQIAMNMLKKDFDIELIAEVTGLSQKQIEKLKNPKTK